jgi:hypothetical protein
MLGNSEDMPLEMPRRQEDPTFFASSAAFLCDLRGSKLFNAKSAKKLGCNRFLLQM